jgi:ribosomal subunit interface protein
MQTPLQLTFRSMAHSDALAAHLEQRAEKLEQFFDRMISCHVVVKLAGHHSRCGDRYQFSINVGLPGHELLVTHVPAEDHDPESAYVSADRAFDEAERQLEDWVRRQRDQRREPATGNVAGRI